MNCWRMLLMFVVMLGAMHAGLARSIGEEKKDAGAAASGSGAGSASEADAPPAKKEVPPADSEKLLAFLQNKVSAIETVQAAFVQTKQLKLFDRKLVLKGRLALHKPDKMAWHVDEPVRYTMLLDGKRLRQWDEDSGQVQTINIGDEPAAKEIFRQFNAWLVEDFASIAKAYDAQIVSREPLVVAFAPKADTPVGQVISNVRMTMGEDYRYVQELRFEEKTGDVTTLEFKGTKLNEPIPAELWEIPKQ